MNIQDLVNDIGFVRSEWIGKGKRYKNVPQHVVNACLAEKKVPDDIKALLPAYDLSISSFTSLHVPSQSRELVSFGESSWYSDKKPTVSANACFQLLWNRSIPSKDTLRALDTAFSQQFLNGSLSIIDPRYSNNLHHLPLWVLTLWNDLSSLLEKQHDLRRTMTFIRQAVSERSVSEQYPDLEVTVGRQGWNTNIVVGGWSFLSQHFTQLLRPGMLCDDMTQVMTQVLQRRLESNESLKAQHVIAASRFYLVLQVAAESNRFDDLKLPRSLREIERVIELHPKIKLWFPVLQPQLKHEVALCVDFETDTISWADSIETFPPPQKTSFKELGNVLPHGVQNDSISCIPASINAIAHGVFGDALWSQDTWRLDRINWFACFIPNISSKEVSATQATGQSARVRPDIENLLNLCEDDAYTDIVHAMNDIDAHENAVPATSTPNPHQPFEVPPSAPQSNDPIQSSAKPNHASSAAAWKQLFSQASKAKMNSSKRHNSDESDSEQRPSKIPKPSNTSGPIGLSKSARSEMASRVAADHGESDVAKRKQWKQDIHNSPN
ncbi:hypothetical protein EV361DRAFT_943953 [Lentinula raphanica]|nr:hypothetical protein EV361DRAFT_943953 [Lentinula raphanica]